MELREISATGVSPYRCFVRGSSSQSEGVNVHTVGFKDGLAVVQTMPPTRLADNAVDRNIDLTKLKKIIVKVDPATGKKYIHKDGKRIEILPQLNGLKISPARPPEDEHGAVSKRAPNLGHVAEVLGGRAPPTSVQTKVFNNVKYHVLSLSVKRPAERATASTMTDRDLCVTVEKNVQTDRVDRRDRTTQTDPVCGGDGDSPFSTQFLEFILGDSEVSERDGCEVNRKMIDTSKLRTKEEINKFNFFNDMRKALSFDRAGNLPIHVSVMQNNWKAVKKNCIVLRAIHESVNIANQQGYAPIHLAVMYDVSVDIVRTLLHHGADLKVSDCEGNSPIHLAIENDHCTVLKVLLNDVSNLNLDVFNYEGFTPLILACLNRSYSNARLLLERDADPNVKDMKSGRTALFHAAELHDVNLVELLLQYKADTKIRNFFGTSAHDAMFELDDMPVKIKFCVLGRDHQRLQNKRKAEGRGEGQVLKKAKLETTPVLRKVTNSEIMIRSKKK